ncbi:MATE family efflux transporter [Alteromonas sp. ASW11-19]|uniref:MATE family efflux transporter n=1 Tax=Alteromonas salexigens TaxID=2982530 RepID=A0ABT2VL37_9ALTE|nr:MATE family efflux transporter [Alteromonas salexigens]MCU7553538.1 MATE family efflux transporter [Alteromonas salexigens]
MTGTTSRWQAHYRLISLAFPMILANITTPLLGLVDTAVLGHMDSSAMLAGASVGTLILTQIYWVCGFLRMSATGMSAQARGNEHQSALLSAKALWQTCAIAALLGGALLLLQVPVLLAGIWLASPTMPVQTHLEAYFTVRVWGAPAAMLNLALVGWLVGQQRTRAVLIIQVVGNLINAGLDMVFVYGLSMSVGGVALASVIAEYTMMAIGLWVALGQCRGTAPQWDWFNSAARKILFKLNGNMLLRNLALQLCLAFLTLQGARLGETPAAVNAILMQFFVLIALGLDGIAYAVEALVGEAAGAKYRRAVRAETLRGLLWSSLFALAYAMGFLVAGDSIIALLTDIPHLQAAASDYLPLMVLLPLLGHWCFLFDGVFVGLTLSGAMRDTMIISAVGVFFPVWWLTKDSGNVALWYALLAFLLARGVTLGGVLIRRYRNGGLFSSRA